MESLNSSDNRFLNAIKKHRWHFIFWFFYWLYCYITDLILYDNTYILKEVILVLSHHVLLFYSLLYCIRKFSNESVAKFCLSIFRFLLALAIFFALRFFINYKIYPSLDHYYGVQRATLVVKQITIGGTLWVIDYFIKAFAYFIFTKLVRKERELRLALEENYNKEKALQEKEIEEERVKQQQMEYERREVIFVNLVHETKTPITLINNYIADHIERHGSSDELEIVRSNVRKLSRDITNLFDLERFRHGVEMFNHRQTVNFSTFLNSTCEQFIPYCHRKDIQLSKTIQEEVMVNADPVALSRIVNNLIENAIKYSDSGTEILLTLSSEGGFVTLTVKDQGPGIDTQEMDHIFTPYHLLAKVKKSIQGMGLGLPMVKQVVESLEGKITVKKGDQGGTVITVLIPGGQSTVLNNQWSGEDVSIGIEEISPILDIRHSATSPSILVVEDNHHLNSYLVRRLGRQYNVRSAINGKDALIKVKEELPDLILSDVMMDDIDGFEFAKIVQMSPGLSHIPIIFLTARVTDVDRLKGLALGAIDYVEKPFVADELLTKIQSLLEITGRQQKKLYDDVYTAVQMLRRKDTASEQSPIVIGTISFDEKCFDMGLTKREVEIARLLVAGKSNKIIAELSFISVKTVETHVKNIYEKAGITNKVEFIRLFQ